MLWQTLKFNKIQLTIEQQCRGWGTDLHTVKNPLITYSRSSAYAVPLHLWLRIHRFNQPRIAQYCGTCNCKNPLSSSNLCCSGVNCSMKGHLIYELPVFTN